MSSSRGMPQPPMGTEPADPSPDGLDPNDPAFDELLRTLMTDIRHHIEEEESELLPKLQAACSEEQLRDLGDKVSHANEMAPTHPHPSAPDKPPANKILGPGTALVDRMRDALTGRET